MLINYTLLKTHSFSFISGTSAVVSIIIECKYINTDKKRNKWITGEAFIAKNPIIQTVSNTRLNNTYIFFMGMIFSFSVRHGLRTRY